MSHRYDPDLEMLKASLALWALIILAGVGALAALIFFLSP